MIFIIMLMNVIYTMVNVLLFLKKSFWNLYISRGGGDNITIT